MVAAVASAGVRHGHGQDADHREPGQRGDDEQDRPSATAQPAHRDGGRRRLGGRRLGGRLLSGLLLSDWRLSGRRLGGRRLSDGRLGDWQFSACGLGARPALAVVLRSHVAECSAPSAAPARRSPGRPSPPPEPDRLRLSVRSSSRAHLARFALPYRA